MGPVEAQVRACMKSLRRIEFSSEDEVSLEDCILLKSGVSSKISSDDPLSSLHAPPSRILSCLWLPGR